MTTPEFKQPDIGGGGQQAEPLVTVIPENINTIPPEVERATGVQPTQTQVTAVVTDDQGTPMMTSQTTSTVTITLPTTTDQLTLWAKGDPSEALTWLASFWLRVVKMAMHFGWNVATGGKPVDINSMK